MDFQQTIFQLKSYWAERGCIIQEPYDVEVGAGTMCPETFLRVLEPKPYRVAYVQSSRRGTDGRYCENRNRLYKHQQLQVTLKPSPALVSQRGCILQEPYEVETGAGTACPETFLRVLGLKPYRVACVQPSRRPPNRLYKRPQLQVISKPSPAIVRQAV